MRDMREHCMKQKRSQEHLKDSSIGTFSPDVPPECIGSTHRVRFRTHRDEGLRRAPSHGSCQRNSRFDLAGLAASGAVVDGIGTWSMHYTGMLAFILPVPVQYDWPTVLLSLAVSMVGSAAALVVVSYGTAEWPQAVAASILLGGVGISGMHYTAMAAMRVPATQHHAPALATVAVMVAMVISLLALWLTILVHEDNEAHRFRRHGSMLLRGDSQSGHALYRHGWCQLYRVQRNPGRVPRHQHLSSRHDQYWHRPDDEPHYYADLQGISPSRSRPTPFADS